MIHRTQSDEEAGAPLPRDWLPEAHPPAEDPAWEGEIARILVAADPELVRRAGGTRPAALPRWTEVGEWWRPALAVAAGAAALFFVVDRPAPTPAVPLDAIALTLVAAQGDPAALWQSLGVRADPVLAHIAMEDHDAFVDPAGPRTPADGEIR